jgi:hypothetical protein
MPFIRPYAALVTKSLNAHNIIESIYTTNTRALQENLDGHPQIETQTYQQYSAE